MQNDSSQNPSVCCKSLRILAPSCTEAITTGACLIIIVSNDDPHMSHQWSGQLRLGWNNSPWINSYILAHSLEQIIPLIFPNGVPLSTIISPSQGWMPLIFNRGNIKFRFVNIYLDTREIDWMCSSWCWFELLKTFNVISIGLLDKLFLFCLV